MYLKFRISTNFSRHTCEISKLLDAVASLKPLLATDSQADMLTKIQA